MYIYIYICRQGKPRLACNLLSLIRAFAVHLRIIGYCNIYWFIALVKLCSFADIWKYAFWAYADSDGPDQPVQQHSLIKGNRLSIFEFGHNIIANRHFWHKSIRMANSVDPDKLTCYLDLHCLQKYLYLSVGRKRVGIIGYFRMYWLRGIDKLSGETILSELFCFPFERSLL